MKTTWILLSFIMFLTSCQKDRSEETIKEKLIGTWIEKKPYSDGLCDTLIFNNYSVQLYFPFDGWSYNIPTNDSIVFTNQEKTSIRGFNFILHNDSELIICNFVDRGITENIKNIIFIKNN